MYCSVVQCVAVCRTWMSSFALSDSPIVAVYCCVVVCCSVLKCVVACCQKLHCVAVCCSVLLCVAMCCTVLHCVALCCTVLQCVTECCMWFSSSSLLDSSTVEQQLQLAVAASQDT